MELELVRSIKIPQSRCRIAVAPDARLIAVNCKREVCMFDDAGNEVSRWAVPGKSSLRSMAIHGEGTYIALDTDKALQLYQPSDELEAEREHGRWGQYSSCTCAFSPDGSYLWAVFPGNDPAVTSVHVLEVPSLRIAAEASLDVGKECGYSFHFHPDGKTVFLEAGAGQDGIWTYGCTFANGRLRVKHLPDLDWRPIFAVHPSGKEILTGSLMDACMQRRSHPRRKVLVDVEGDYCYVRCDPIYLDRNRIVALTGEEELVLLDAQSLEIEDRLETNTSGYVTEIQLLGDILITSHSKGKCIRLWACP